MNKTVRRHVLVWLALLALLAMTLASAYLRLGVWNTVINFVIAAAKAALVALFFMGLAQASAVVRIFAAGALFTLTLLFSLSATDYATRSVYRAPWQTPQQVAPVAGHGR